MWMIALLLLIINLSRSFSFVLKGNLVHRIRLNMVSHPSSRRIAYELGKLDIRVGKILSCDVLESDKSRFVSIVDVGDPEPRTIITRMANLLKRDRFFLRDNHNVVCCNTEPVNVNGILSRGNFFYSENFFDNYALLTSTAKPGSRIFIDGLAFNPISPSAEANCAYMLVKPHLEVAENGGVLLHPEWLGRQYTGVWYAGDEYVSSGILDEIQGYEIS